MYSTRDSVHVMREGVTHLGRSVKFAPKNRDSELSFTIIH